MAEPRKISLAVRLGRWTARRAKRPWLPLAVPAFPMADFILPVMPNQLLLAGLSLVAPQRWPVFVLAFAIGTALGGTMVAVALQSLGVDRTLFVSAEEAGGPLAEALAQFRRHGLWFLAGVALLPWTPRLTVVACALAGLAPVAILGTLFVTRLVPCAALAIAGAYAPRWSMRFGFVERFVVRARKAFD